MCNMNIDREVMFDLVNGYCKMTSTTLGRVSIKVGLNEDTLRRIFRNKCDSAREETIRAIANFLGVEFSLLLKDPEEKIKYRVRSQDIRLYTKVSPEDKIKNTLSKYSFRKLSKLHGMSESFIDSAINNGKLRTEVVNAIDLLSYAESSNDTDDIENQVYESDNHISEDSDSNNNSFRNNNNAISAYKAVVALSLEELMDFNELYKSFLKMVVKQ